MRVKICGITSLNDALMAIDAGADALGFVFYKKSPRYISVSNAKKIIKDLPPFIEKVALFVNENTDFINKSMKESSCTLAQLHFNVSKEICEKIESPYIKVVRARKHQDIDKYKDEFRLVDTYTTAYGGTGKQINLDWFKGKDCSKIILAGGLDYKNIPEIKKQFNFYGFDVSSGVEKSYGIKDEDKIIKFIQNAKHQYIS